LGPGGYLYSFRERELLREVIEVNTGWNNSFSTNAKSHFDYANHRVDLGELGSYNFHAREHRRELSQRREA
jgi:hypothetical protein